MASNLHKDLTDLQLHVPKGFASAANSTTCQKDATGNLVWAAGGGGGTTTIQTTHSWNGTFNNKSGGASNWKGCGANTYTIMNEDFLATGTADFDHIWEDIIPATKHVITADSTLKNFDGQIYGKSSVTANYALWLVRPLCAGANKGTLTLINNQSLTLVAGIYQCFASAATFTFLKGDIIVPLINSSGNGIINFTTSIRLEKT